MKRLLRTLVGMGLLLTEPKQLKKLVSRMGDFGESASKGCENAAGQVNRRIRSMQGKNRSSLASAMNFMAGVGIGAATALLIAPLSGEDFRRSLSRMALDFKSGVRRRVDMDAGVD